MVSYTKSSKKQRRGFYQLIWCVLYLGTSLCSLRGSAFCLCLQQKAQMRCWRCLVFLLLLSSPIPGGKLHLKLLSDCIRTDIPRLSSLHLKIVRGNPPEIKAIHFQSAVWGQSSAILIPVTSAPSAQQGPSARPCGCVSGKETIAQRLLGPRRELFLLQVQQTVFPRGLSCSSPA